MKKVTIVGGGASAHVLAPLLSSLNYQVTILTRKPKLWKENIKVEFKDEFGNLEKEIGGTLKLITDNTKQAIESADIIILCLPVAKYFSMLMKIGQYIPREREVFVGMLYGQGGVNLMFQEMKKKFNLTNMVYFSYGLIPFICRIKKYGEIGITYGAKCNNVVAVHPREKFNKLNEIFLRKVCYCFFNNERAHQSDNFVSLTLSASNQIIHISRMYGLYCKNKEGWKNKEDIPYFYRDFDSFSADTLEALDKDYEKIREKIKKTHVNEDFKYMINFLDLVNFSYNLDNKNIQESFTTSKTLNQITTPVVFENNKYVLDKNSRFFTDDIFYGLAIAKWIGNYYKLELPMIDTLLKWTEDYLGIKIIENNILNENCSYNNVSIGLPSKYSEGISEKFID